MPQLVTLASEAAFSVSLSLSLSDDASECARVHAKNCAEAEEAAKAVPKGTREIWQWSQVCSGKQNGARKVRKFGSSGSRHFVHVYFTEADTVTPTHVGHWLAHLLRI